MSTPPQHLDEVRELYAGTYRRLVGIVALAAGSRADAEECVQEAFVRLIPRWSTVRRYDDPEAWVRLVAFRLLSSRWRSAAVARRAQPRLAAPAAVPGPDPSVLVLEAALAELPLEQRQVLVLHHLVGLGVDEIADALHLPTGRVKSRLYRGREALRPMLREESVP